MKIINIGILAHVDAGKTTLPESLLSITNRCMLYMCMSATYNPQW